MRITLKLAPVAEKLILPLHYNSLVQGFIYHHLDEVVSNRLHNEGVPFGKRQFRFFTFSRIIGEYRINSGNIEFRGPIEIHIGSIHENVLESLVKHLLTKRLVPLGDEQCELLEIEVEKLPKFTRPIKVKTLSPITTYSTLTTGNGRKKTYYYSPTENDWELQILANLRRKSQALGWEQDAIELIHEARVKSIKVEKRDLQIVRYRETVIKGWTGIYELDLPEPFFYLAYDAGLGSKNSQGFGMVKVVEDKKTIEG